MEYIGGGVYGWKKLLMVFLWMLLSALRVCDARSKVILVSFDGFRYDYVSSYKPDSLLRLAKEGVHAPEGIIPAFATKTFPNHFTIVTGLYEETHGIIDNDMYDPVLKAGFQLSDTDPKWWNGGEPIWVTAKKQGRKTATIFWPGGDVVINGMRPDFFVPYDSKTSFDDRVDKAVKLMKDDKVDFVAMYFEDPDTTAHKYGISSSKMKDVIDKINKTIRNLLEKLKQEGLLDEVDLIIMADHGMVNTSNIPKDDSLVIYLDKLIDRSDVDMIPQRGSVAGILPKKGREQAVYDMLVKGEHMRVFLKEDIPERWHYKNHHRVMPILAVADEGYIIVQDKTELKSGLYTIGQHGYDNDLKSMRPIFFARGPSFKSGRTILPFENVNIYSLLCHLLEVQPTANNGSMEVFKDILANGKQANRCARWQANMLAVFLNIMVWLTIR